MVKCFLMWLVVVGLVLVPLSSCSRPPEFNGTAFDNPTPAYPFAGVNADGAPFRLHDQLGNVVVIFFGYTFCPDICPLTLAELNQVVKKLGAKADALRVVFITIDPERDTLDRLAAYVGAFNPSFYGVRLEGQQYEATKAAYGVFAQKSEAKVSNDPNSYFMDHSAGIYVIDKKGNLSEAFRYDAGADAMLPDLEYWLAQ
ncbi:MAG: SCO family protein [Caldilineaceae bacterium]